MVLRRLPYALGITRQGEYRRKTKTQNAGHDPGNGVFHEAVSVGDAGVFCAVRPLYASKYAAGTIKTVSTTETVSPPMMARASGAYCSLPVPSFRAMGIIPIMVANDVINIGRSRTLQEVITASSTDFPCSSSRCVNSTIKMLFDAAIPTNISTPMSDITFRVVPVSGRMIRTPMNPMGTASMISNGSLNDLNCAT